MFKRTDLGFCVAGDQSIISTPHRFLQLRPMSFRIQNPRTVRRIARSKLFEKRGMTLFEVMLAAFILVLALGAVLEVLIQSYRLTLLTRHSDNARAVLVSLTNQFSRLTPVDSAAARLPMWQATDTTSTGPYGTGYGVSWESNGDTKVGTITDTDGLKIELGSTEGSQIPAYIFRKVQFVVPGTGVENGATETDIIQATFTIRFQINGDWKSQSMTIARFWHNDT